MIIYYYIRSERRVKIDIYKGPDAVQHMHHVSSGCSHQLSQDYTSPLLVHKQDKKLEESWLKRKQRLKMQLKHSREVITHRQYP